MADRSEERWRAVFPDLQSAPRILHAVELVAPDAVVQRAMRHSSPETKRHCQLGIVDQVREGIEQANEKAFLLR
jgi:hypothetical protein